MFFNLFISFVFLSNLFGFYTVYAKKVSDVYREDGLIENTQIAFIVISFILFSVLAVRSVNIRKRLLSLTLALLCFSFFLREVTVENFALPSIVILLGSGQGYRILLAILWSIVIIATTILLKKITPFYLTYIISSAGRALFISAAFLIAGSFFDREIFDIAHSEFYEELLEMNGYFMLTLGAFLTWGFDAQTKK